MEETAREVIERYDKYLDGFSEEMQRLDRVPMSIKRYLDYQFYIDKYTEYIENALSENEVKEDFIDLCNNLKMSGTFNFYDIETFIFETVVPKLKDIGIKKTPREIKKWIM